MISTPVTDLGVDHPNAQCIVNSEFPNLASLFQQEGRGSCNNQLSAFIIAAGVTSYLMLYRRINTNIDIKGDSSNVNEAAQAASEKAFNNFVASPTKQKSKFVLMLEKDYSLSPNEKRSLRIRQTNDLLAVFRFYCLDLGFMHRRREVYLAIGVLNTIPLRDNICGDACPVCNDEWAKTFLPVRTDGLIKFFKCVNNLPCKANYGNLLKLIWRQEYWFHVIFDKAFITVS